MNNLKSVVQNVLDSVQASAADISVANGNVTITGVPAFRHTEVDDYVIKKSITETVERIKCHFAAAAANTQYAFSISQDIGGVRTPFLIEFNSGAATSNAEVEDSLVAQIQAHVDNGSLKVAVSALAGASSQYGPLITGIAGYPDFQVNGVTSTLTEATDQSYADNAAQAGAFFAAVVSVLAGTTTVTVTSTGHSLLEGMKVKVTGYGGTMNGQASAVGVTARVTTVTANTFVLDGVVGASLTLSTTRVEVVATRSFGTGASLVAKQVPSATSGNTYSLVEISFRKKDGRGDNGGDSFFRTEVYVNEGDTDASDFLDRIGEIKNGYGAGVTTADPALIAK